MTKNYSLQVLRDLIDDLNSSGVRYCHWKGTEHLDATLAGEGDVDLLFHRDDLQKVQAVFAALGFRYYAPMAGRYNSGVQDFIGFDETSGAIVHLHTYYRLVMGDPQLQEYRLPWEGDILATAAPNDAAIPLPVPAPEAELLVLIARSCLKARLRDRFFRAAYRRTLFKDYERNRQWLCERVDESKLRMLADKWLLSDLWPEIKEAAYQPVNAAGMLKLGKRVTARLARFRTYGRVESFVRGRLREAVWAAGAINRRYLYWPVPWRRTGGHGGAIICLLGADGSGKSTLTSEMHRWLTYKLDAIPVYMGSGDGPGSILRLPLKLLRKIIPSRLQRRRARHAKSDNPAGQPKVRDPLLVQVGLLVWGVVLAIEKRRKLYRVRTAANRGMIVLADRYPQAQTFGYNDGPLLQDFAVSRLAWLRAVARWELGIYRLAEQIRPDLVIKLTVTPEVAISRKPEMQHDEIVRRNDAVEAFSFPAETKVVKISADRPLAEVLLLAKKAIWSVA